MINLSYLDILFVEKASNNIVLTANIYHQITATHYMQPYNIRKKYAVMLGIHSSSSEKVIPILFKRPMISLKIQFPQNT